MINTTQLGQFYQNIIDRARQVATHNMLVSQAYNPVSDDYTLSEFQWDNLVKVCSIIKANDKRFNMTTWHDKNKCGTVHCIAGWAASLALSDTNISGFSHEIVEISQDILNGLGDMQPNYYNEYTTPDIAKYMLSDAIYPFFLLNFSNLGNIPEGMAETLVMEELIDPILEMAKEQRKELSAEVQQFIQKAQKETCSV
jgi:hypothetical protein